MLRKIVRQGAATMTVSLPSAWIRRFGLQPGDMVNVTEGERTLHVSTDRQMQASPAEIDIRGRHSSYVWRKLLGLYRAGTETINVRHDNQFELVSRIAESRIGLGIVAHDTKRIVVQDLSGTGDIDFSMIYRRCFRLLQEQCRSAIAMIEENRDLGELVTMDYSLNQMTDYCLRYLSKRGYGESNTTHLYYHIINEIEYIGDILTRLHHTYHGGKEKKEVLETLHIIDELLEQFHHTVFNWDEEGAEKLITRCRELRERCATAQNPSVITLLQIPSVVKNTFNSVLSLRLST